MTDIPTGRLFAYIEGYIIGVPPAQGGGVASVMHGEGAMIWRDGTIYKGALQGGLRHGHGVTTKATGETYTGEYQNDKQDGVGTYTFSSGDTYQGEYKGDRKHGQGSKLQL